MINARGKLCQIIILSYVLTRFDWQLSSFHHKIVVKIRKDMNLTTLRPKENFEWEQSYDIKAL